MMNKIVEIEFDVETAKAMLETEGCSTDNLSEDEISQMVMERTKPYGTDYKILNKQDYIDIKNVNYGPVHGFFGSFKRDKQ